MKTLKQKLEECADEDNWCNIGIETALELFKKWLQQKQKDEYKNWYKELNEILRIVYRAKNIILKELLEELE